MLCPNTDNMVQRRNVQEKLSQRRIVPRKIVQVRIQNCLLDNSIGRNVQRKIVSIRIVSKKKIIPVKIVQSSIIVPVFVSNKNRLAIKKVRSCSKRNWRWKKCTGKISGKKCLGVPTRSAKIWDSFWRPDNFAWRQFLPGLIFLESAQFLFGDNSFQDQFSWTFLPKNKSEKKNVQEKIVFGKCFEKKCRAKNWDSFDNLFEDNSYRDNYWR